MEGTSQLQNQIKNQQNEDKQVFSVSREKKEGKLARKGGKMIVYLQQNQREEQQTAQDKAWRETCEEAHTQKRETGLTNKN